jgi:hypothetical protein
MYARTHIAYAKVGESVDVAGSEYAHGGKKEKKKRRTRGSRGSRGARDNKIALSGTTHIYACIHIPAYVYNVTICTFMHVYE